MENWKPLPIRPTYSCSDQGQIRNDQTGHILKQSLSAKGYSRVSIPIPGETNPRIVFPHRETARLHVPNPDNKPTVNHIDGNKANPKASNLEWATHKEQAEHAARIGIADFKSSSMKANEASLKVNSKPVALTDFTGEKTYFKSMSECSKHLGVKNDKLREALKFDGDFDGLRIERL